MAIIDQATSLIEHVLIKTEQQLEYKGKMRKNIIIGGSRIRERRREREISRGKRSASANDLSIMQCPGIHYLVKTLSALAQYLPRIRFISMIM